ncbi:MAG TPA: phage tail tape measure protein [Candidatus Saccharimonadales bacterium]|nr:phage tail tape measure protein [Candidatus Saccharimonadales bacterium]
MADRVVRVLVTADTAAALAKIEEVGAVSDETAEQSAAVMGEATAATGGMFTKIGSGLAGLPLVGGAFQKMGESISKADTTGQKFGAALSGIGKLAAVGVAAGLAGAAAESMRLADEFDKATNSIAANAGISQKAAKAIGDSFLNSAQGTIYSGTQTATAYAGVAAQLATVQGKALNAAQASSVMTAAMQLSEATGGDLNSTTTDLATTMQLYGLKANQAADASNILYNAGKETGTGMDAVTKAVTKLHSQLGVATPPLSQVGALLEDLAKHGESGRQGLSAASTAMATLMKASVGVITAQQNAKSIFDEMSPSLQTLADKYQSGAMSYTVFDKAAQGLGQTQYQLASQWMSSASAVQTAQSKMAEMGITVDTARGKFVGMASVITQLHTKIQGMSQAQALATVGQVFGVTAAQKMLTTVEAGPAAYEKSAAAIAKHNSTADAASKAMNNMSDQFKIIGKDVEDVGIKVGEVLLPPVEKFMGFLTGHMWVLGIVAGLVGVGLVAAMTAYAVSAATAAAASIGVWGPILLIVAGVALLVAGIILLVTHWNQVWGAIVATATGVWNNIKSGLVDPIVNFFISLPNTIKNAFGTLASAITSPFRDAFNLVATLWNNTLGKLSFSIPGWVPMIGGDKFSLPRIPTLATGGMVTGDGLAYLHAGEVVVNQQQQVAAAGGGGSQVNINVTSNDGQAVVNALKLYMQSHGSVPIRTTG